MNPLRWTQSLILILLTALLITACGSSDEESIAVSVALTQTAAAQATEDAVATAPEATEAPQEIFAGDLQPLSADECDQLAAFMVNRLPITPEQHTLSANAEYEPLILKLLIKPSVFTLRLNREQLRDSLGLGCRPRWTDRFHDPRPRRGGHIQGAVHCALAPGLISPPTNSGRYHFIQPMSTIRNP